MERHSTSVLLIQKIPHQQAVLGAELEGGKWVMTLRSMLWHSRNRPGDMWLGEAKRALPDRGIHTPFTSTVFFLHPSLPKNGNPEIQD